MQYRTTQTLGPSKSASRVLPSPSHVRVVYKIRPFEEGANYALLDPGMSVSAIARSVGMTKDFWIVGVAQINGHVIPRRLWASVKPKAGAELVLQLRIQKKVVKAVVDAVVGVVKAVKEVFSPSTPKVAKVQSTTSNLSVASISPPPALSGSAAITGSGGASDASSADAGRQGSAALVGNVLTKGQTIPRVLGTMRVFPPFITEPLLENIGDDEYAEGILGLAGLHDLSTLRIGDVSADDISDLQYQFTSGRPGDTAQDLVSRQSRTIYPQVRLSQHRLDPAIGVTSLLEDQNTPGDSCPQYHQVTSRENPDEVWLTLEFTQGLWDASEPAAEMMLVPFRIRFRKRGDTDWINCPEIHLNHDEPNRFVRTVKFIFSAATNPVPAPPSDRGFVRAYTTVPGSTVDPVGLDAYSADDYFYSGSGDTLIRTGLISSTGVINTHLYSDRCEFYLDGFDPGSYEFEVRMGQAYIDDDFIYDDYEYAGDFNVYSLFEYWSDTVNYYSAGGLADRYYECFVSRVTSVWNEYPVLDENICQVAIRVRNRSLSDISVLASGLVPDYLGGTWENVIPSSNPATLFRYVLSGALNADPLPLSLLDDDELIEWREFCNTNNYTCNAVVGGESIIQILTMISSCGWARPRLSEVWGVMTDNDRTAETPVQMFSARNMSGFQWERSFERRPDALRVRFTDENNDYREGEIIVYDPEQDTGGEFIEDIRYDGLTTEAKARARAVFDLGQARLRPVSYSGSVGWSSLRARRGDLVAVQHDNLQYRGGFARIKEVLRGSPPDLVGLTLDGTIYNDTYGFFIPSTETPVDGMLDTYPGALNAYSFRRLTVNYGGSAIRLREDGGNTLADIGFDENGDLDVAAVAAHLGGNNGFIHTFYDQIGSADLVQTTNSLQPAYTASGANSKPTATFTAASNHYMLSAAQSVPMNSTTSSVFAVHTLLAAGEDWGRVLSFQAQGDTSDWEFVTSCSFITQDSNNERLRSTRNTVATSQVNVTYGASLRTAMIYSLTEATITVNGTSDATPGSFSGTLGGANGGRYYIGAPSHALTTENLGGEISEIVVYDSDQTANLSAIQTNQSTFDGSGLASDFFIDDSFFVAPRLGIAIAMPNGEEIATLEATGAQGDITDLSLVTPYDDSANPVVPGLHITSGPLGTEYKRLIILSIEPRADLTADIIMVDEAPEIWSLDLGGSEIENTYTTGWNELDTNEDVTLTNLNLTAERVAT